MGIRYLKDNASSSALATHLTHISNAYIPAVARFTQPQDDINTARTTGNYQPGAVTIRGVYVLLMRNGSTGTFTVKLMEGATERATTVSINVTAIINNASSSGWAYVAFSVPYACSGATNYQVRCTGSNAGQLSWKRDAGAGTYGFALEDTTDDASGLTSGDTLFVGKGVTLTLDASLTVGPTNNYSLILGDQSVLSIPNPAAPITLVLGAGKVYMSSECSLTWGTAGTAISTGALTITSSIAQADFLFDAQCAYGGNALAIVAIYGVVSNDLRLVLSADAAASQAVITTVEDIPASWAASATPASADIVTFAAKDTIANDAVEYKIHSKGAKTVTLDSQSTATMTIANPCVATIVAGMVNGDYVSYTTTIALPTGITAGTVYYVRTVSGATYHLYDTQAHAIDTGSTTGRVGTSGSQSGVHTATYEANLNVLCLKGGAILNVSEARRLGIQINSTNQIFLFGFNSSTSFCTSFYSCTMKGVYLGNVIYSTGVTYSASAVYESNFSYINYGAAAQGASMLMDSVYGGSTVTNCHFINQNGIYAVTLGIGLNSSMTKITLRNLGDNAVSGANVTITDLIQQGTYNNSFKYGLTASATNFKLINSMFIGCGAYFSGGPISLVNYNQQRVQGGFNGWGTVLYNAIAFSASNSTFGVGTTNPAFDIYSTSSTFDQAVFTDCLIGSKGIGNTTLMFNGSYLQWHNYGQVTGDNRTWKPYANFTTDSPYTNLVQTPVNTTQIGENVFELLTQSVLGYVHTLLFTASVNANYDNGVYTNPKVDIFIDSNPTTGTPDQTVNVTTIDGADHTYSGTFTPTTNLKKVSLALRTKTDQASTPVKWSAMKVLQRTYGKTYTSLDLSISETITYPIATLATPAANPYITQATQSTVHAYTGISFDGTLHVTEPHTRQEIYDWTQDYLSLNQSVAQFLDTTDGTNYTLSCPFENTSAITGGGSYNVGANAYTGGGTYDGVIITSTDRIVHALLTGLVAGSTVQIYDTTDSSELYNDVVAGTSLDYLFTWTIDHAVRIRVRYAVGTTGYIPYETTGTITQNGLAITIGQQPDLVFNANAIDGSAVTEFSLSGSTIKIYIDDPTNATTAQRLYSWYLYSISTQTYIGIQPNDITAQTSWSYVLADAIQIYNQDLVNPLFLTGANMNNVSNNGQVIDTAGGIININGYFPFNSANDIKTTVGALTLGQFVGLK